MFQQRAKLFFAGMLMGAAALSGCTNVRLSAWCNEIGSAYCGHCEPAAVAQCLAAFVPSCLAGRDPNMVTNRKRRELDQCVNDMRTTSCEAVAAGQMPQSCQQR